MRWPVVAAGATALALISAACANPFDTGERDRVALDVFGPYRGVEADDFAASLLEFELRTGIRVNYTGTANFVQDLRQRVAGGIDVPDIAVVPQPGLVAELITSDAIVELPDATRATIAENYDLAVDDEAVEGGTYFAPYRVSVKSLVWYRPSVFEEFGWEVPTTLAELEQLADDIQATRIEDTEVRIAPWCFSMASGSATGWPATDWVEDLVLRLGGVDVYDEWASGERGFDDPVVREALARFDQLVRASGRTAGGLRTILQREVDRASGPLFEFPPGCAMYKQASFAESWFPDDVDVGDDVDFFVLPGESADEPAPILVGGDSLVQFSDDDDVDRLMVYLVSPDGARVWAERGGYLSSRTSVDPARYYRNTDRRFAELLRDEGRDLRFDMSDLLPPDIGSGLLWQEVTTWVAGTSTTDQFVTTIDEAVAAVAEEQLTALRQE